MFKKIILISASKSTKCDWHLVNNNLVMQAQVHKQLRKQFLNVEAPRANKFHKNIMVY